MANIFYVTIEGSQQGIFSDENTVRIGHGKLRGNGLPGDSYHHEIKSPIDMASGMITGKIQHQPITFRHVWGSSTPQLFRATTTNELLNRVVFDFTRTSELGVEEIFYKVTLTNAHITGIQYVTDPITASTSSLPEAELISFVYEKIDVQYVLGKTSASAEWTGASG